MRQRASYTHSVNELRSANPLYARTLTARSVFEAERCPLHAQQLADANKSEAERRRELLERGQRRDSFMIKRQQPKPVLRPSRTLSYGPDRAAFNRQLRDDDKQARSPRNSKAALKDAYTMRDDLIKDRTQLSQQENKRKALRSDSKDARRELFKIQRSVGEISKHANKRFHEFQRRHGNQ